MSLTDRTIAACNSFRREEEGAVAVIVAMMLTVLLGFVALGVDVASLYRDRARLQGATDLTAMAVAADPAQADVRAAAALAGNARRAERVTAIVQGRFLRNPALPRNERFVALVPGDPAINAAQVGLADDAPLHFGRIFSDADTVALSGHALAVRTQGASFTLDSALVDIDGTALNAMLATEFGTSAQVDIADISLLADQRISLGTLLDALGGSETANPAEVLDRQIDMAELIDALNGQLPLNLHGALSGLRAATQGEVIDIAAVVGGIDTALGLTVTDFLAESELSALDILRALPRGAVDAVLDSRVVVPGVMSVETRLMMGEAPADSGWVALGEEGVTLERAAARLSLEAGLAPSLLGTLGAGVEVVSVDLPLQVELAGARATLEEIACAGQAPNDLAASFLTSATPLHPGNGTAIAALYLGATGGGALIDPQSLGFADILTLRIVIPLPLLPDLVISDLRIQARSHVAVGASRTERITFSRGDVREKNTARRFGSEELIGTAVASLLSPENTEFRVAPGQEGLVSGVAAPVIGAVLAAWPSALVAGLADPVDQVLDSLLDGLGVTLGTGKLNLTRHHCERIRLMQ